VGVLDAQIDRLGALGCRHVVVHLGGLEEIDAVGARLLDGITHYVGGLGGVVRLTGATGAVRACLRADAEPAADASH
jgi:anti-anti-sigma regulatory factor